MLTTAGKFFKEKATIILNEYQATLRELKDFHHQPTLRIGTLRTIRIASLAELIRDFQTQHPNVLFELLDGTLNNLHSWLEDGDSSTQEEWVIALVAAGQGVTIMPEWQQEKAIVYIPISDLPLPRTIALMWRIGQNSQILDEFRAFAASHNW